MGVSFWRGTGVAAALCACGGTDAQRTANLPVPPSATAAPSATASSAPASSDRAPAPPAPPALDFVVATKREATEPRKSYAITLGAGITVEAESTTEPKVTTGQSSDGHAYASFPLTFAKEAGELGCIYRAGAMDFGATLEQVLTASLSKNANVKLKSADFTLDTVERTALPTWIAYYEMSNAGKKTLGTFSFSAFRLGLEGTMVCLFDGVGFRMSVASMVRHMAKTVRPKPLEQALYWELHKESVERTPVGYSERWYVPSPQGFTWTELMSLYAIKVGGVQFRIDTGASGTVDREGRVLTAREAVEATGELSYIEELERAGQGVFRYSIKRGAAVDAGTVKGELTSELSDREALRKLFAGSTADLTVTSFRSKPPAIAAVHVSREAPGSGTVLFDDGGSAPTKCELDAEGRCRVRSTGELTSELVTSGGSYPRVKRK
jgi:hypothetical protein